MKKKHNNGLWKSIFNEDHCKGNFNKNYKTKHIKPFYRTERY